MSRAQKFKEHQWQNLIVFVLCYNYICLCCEWIIHKHFFLLKSLGSHPPSLSLMTSLFKREIIKRSWCFASWWCLLWPLCWFVWFVPVRKVIRQISRLVNLWIQRVVKATANLKENNSNWKLDAHFRHFPAAMWKQLADIAACVTFSNLGAFMNCFTNDYIACFERTLAFFGPIFHVGRWWAELLMTGVWLERGGKGTRLSDCMVVVGELSRSWHGIEVPSPSLNNPLTPPTPSKSHSWVTVRFNLAHSFEQAVSC